MRFLVLTACLLIALLFKPSRVLASNETETVNETVNSTGSEPADMSQQSAGSFFEKLINYMKDNPVLVALIIIIIVLILEKFEVILTIVSGFVSNFFMFAMIAVIAVLVLVVMAVLSNPAIIGQIKYYLSAPAVNPADNSSAVTGSAIMLLTEGGGEWDYSTNSWTLS